jgi:hypothetical protein
LDNTRNKKTSKAAEEENLVKEKKLAKVVEALEMCDVVTIYRTQALFRVEDSGPAFHEDDDVVEFFLSEPIAINHLVMSPLTRTAIGHAVRCYIPTHDIKAIVIPKYLSKLLREEHGVVLERDTMKWLTDNIHRKMLSKEKRNKNNVFAIFSTSIQDDIGLNESVPRVYLSPNHNITCVISKPFTVDVKSIFTVDHVASDYERCTSLFSGHIDNLDDELEGSGCNHGDYGTDWFTPAGNDRKEDVESSEESDGQ